MDGENEVKVTGIEKGSVGDIEVFAKFKLEEVTDGGEGDTDAGLIDKITGKVQEILGGCNGSVSAIGMGVVALAAAAIVLKKKED